MFDVSAVLTSGTCLCTCMHIFMYIYSFAVASLPCVSNIWSALSDIYGLVRVNKQCSQPSVSCCLYDVKQF